MCVEDIYLLMGAICSYCHDKTTTSAKNEMVNSDDRNRVRGDDSHGLGKELTSAPSSSDRGEGGAERDRLEGEDRGASGMKRMDTNPQGTKEDGWVDEKEFIEAGGIPPRVPAVEGGRGVRKDGGGDDDG